MKQVKFFWVSKEKAMLGYRYQLVAGSVTVATFRRDATGLADALNRIMEHYIAHNYPLRILQEHVEAQEEFACRYEAINREFSEERKQSQQKLRDALRQLQDDFADYPEYVRHPGEIEEVLTSFSSEGKY